jgi:hypothetical protein
MKITLTIALILAPTIANAMTPQMQQCTIWGKAETERLDKADPEYFKDAAVLYGDGDVEEYKKLYALKQASRCNFMIDCQRLYSERVCRVMQPY